MSKLGFYSEFDHPHPRIDFSDSPSMTRQEFAAEANVNNLLKRYAQTGAYYDPANVTPSRQALFGDFTKYNDFQSCQDMVLDAQERFDLLPAEIRSKFNYDPAKLIAFLSDDKNRSEAESLGLIAKAAEAASPEPATAATAAVDEPATATVEGA